VREREREREREGERRGSVCVRARVCVYGESVCVVYWYSIQ